MFKNNNEKNKSIEELEKKYEYQEKLFNEKIAKQQERINDMTDYISAMFGESVFDTNVGVKLNNLENALNKIEMQYKENIRQNTKELKKEFEKAEKKIVEDLNKAQTEVYFEFSKTNEENMLKLNKLFSEKEENSEKISDLAKIIKTYIKENELYKKETQEDLKSTNQKIGKINYLGITNKFDKKLKEECKKIDDKLENIKNETKIDFANLDKKYVNQIGQVQANLQINGEELIKLQTMFVEENNKVSSDIENNANMIVGLDEKISKEVESIDEKIHKVEDLTNDLDKKIIEKIVVENENTRNSITDLEQKTLKVNEKIQKIEEAGKELEGKISKHNEEINELIKNSDAKINKLDESLTEKIEQIDLKLKENRTEINKSDKRFIKEVEKVNKEIQNNKEFVSKLEQKITEDINTNTQNNNALLNNINEKLAIEITDIKLNLQNSRNEIEKVQKNFDKEIENILLSEKNSKIAIEKIENKFIKEIQKVNKKVQSDLETVNDLEQKVVEEINTKLKNYETTISELKEELTNEIIQTKGNIDKLKDISKNNNIKLEESIKLSNKNLTNVQDEINALKDNLALDVTKIKEEVNEQIANNYNENKIELQNIVGNIDVIKQSTQESLENVEVKLLELKQEIKDNTEKQARNTDIDNLKKEYNKQVTKINNDLAKISKDLLNAQKKNLEQNRDLQVKIKAYIDAKLEKNNSIESVEKLINNLNLSILEREKLQKIEMEEMLNKKLKAIQKENERILNKKIEEISSKFIRENAVITNTQSNPNKVTIYKESPKKKKNLYELIDENEMLKRSASSKKNIPTSNGEAKSQILKFFYDDEE